MQNITPQADLHTWWLPSLKCWVSAWPIVTGLTVDPMSCEAGGWPRTIEVFVQLRLAMAMAWPSAGYSSWRGRNKIPPTEPAC